MILAQKVGDKIRLELKGVASLTSGYNYGEGFPGTYAIAQLMADYQFHKQISLGAFYRYFQVPSGIDQFSVAAPTSSNLVGIQFNYKL